MVNGTQRQLIGLSELEQCMALLQFTDLFICLRESCKQMLCNQQMNWRTEQVNEIAELEPFFKAQLWAKALYVPPPPPLKLTNKT